MILPITNKLQQIAKNLLDDYLLAKIKYYATFLLGCIAEKKLCLAHNLHTPMKQNTSKKHLLML